MRIYICDDEIPILRDLERKVKEYVPDGTICCFSSALDLCRELEAKACDVLLLDIDMPQMGGMDIARKLNGKEHAPLLVFVTSHDELVYESLQYHPFGFIRKSYFELEIEKVLRDCRQQLETADKRFHFRMAGREAAILLSEILYFEADKNYLKVYTRSGSYRFRSTIAAVENCLAGDGFVRVHKGFLVNQMAVNVISREDVRLVDGTVLSLGKHYAEESRKRLLEYMREM